MSLYRLPTSAPTNMSAHIHAACFQFLHLAREFHTVENLKRSVLHNVENVMIYSWGNSSLFEGLDIQVLILNSHHVSLSFISPYPEIACWLNGLDLSVKLEISDDYFTD